MTETSAANMVALTRSAPPSLPHVGGGGDLERLRESARGFESVFLAQMLRPMLESPGSAPPFGGGFAEDLWRGSLAESMGDAISRAGGIGLADTVVEQVLAKRAAAATPQTVRIDA